MDVSAIIVIVLLTALFLGSIVGLEIHSRRMSSMESPAEDNEQT